MPPNISPYRLAERELMALTPNLLDLDHADAMAAIDALDWTPPALSFNPWQWYSIAKHVRGTSA